jgi:hypothetical protein
MDNMPRQNLRSGRPDAVFIILPGGDRDRGALAE